MRPNVLAPLLVFFALCPAPSGRAALQCKDPIRAARAELVACQRGQSGSCSFDKYEALRATHQRCLETRKGKALQAFYLEVKRTASIRRLEATLRGKLKSAAAAVTLARPGELPETLEIASFARAAYHSHKEKYGRVSAQTESAVASLDAALRKRKPDLERLKDRLDLAGRAIVRTGQYSSDDGLRPDKVAEVWARASRRRLVQVRSLMNSSLQQFVWAPSDAPDAQVDLVGDRTATPTFQLGEVGSRGVQMRIVIARGALLSIGTPLLVWEADLEKEYFIGIAPDGGRFRIPYVIKDGAKTYRTVEPLAAGGLRFTAMRHPNLPGGALVDLARVGVLSAPLVSKVTTARAAAVECYGRVKGRLQSRLAALRKGGDLAAADELLGKIPDRARAKCAKPVKRVKRAYSKLMKRFALTQARAFARVRGLFDAPSK